MSSDRLSIVIDKLSAIISTISKYFQLRNIVQYRLMLTVISRLCATCTHRLDIVHGEP